MYCKWCKSARYQWRWKENIVCFLWADCQPIYDFWGWTNNWYALVTCIFLSLLGDFIEVLHLFLSFISIYLFWFDLQILHLESYDYPPFLFISGVDKCNCFEIICSISSCSFEVLCLMNINIYLIDAWVATLHCYWPLICHVDKWYFFPKKGIRKRWSTNINN